MKQETFFIKNAKGLKMAIRLTRPDCFNKLAFIEHGLSGNKNENHFIILEEVLSQKGYMVVNFDATDSLNDSDHSQEGLSFTGHYEDLEDVISWASLQSWFISPFTLAGHSMGAACVVLYAENYPNRVNLLLALSFPWISGESKINQPEYDTKWKERGFFDKISSKTGLVLRVPYRFMEDLCQYNFADHADKITAKTILIIGDKENQRRLDDNQMFFNCLTCKKEFVLLKDVPHALAGTQKNAALFTEALETLVL